MPSMKDFKAMHTVGFRPDSENLKSFSAGPGKTSFRELLCHRISVLGGYWNGRDLSVS